MTYQEFLNHYNVTVADSTVRRDLRPGQYAMNLLADVRPELYGFVTGWYGVDCFYRDEFLPRFWEELAVQWDLRKV
jgi:hypothetical protein